MIERMCSNLIPNSIVRRWLDSLAVTTIHPVPCGMSGARVFCCTSADGDRFALKRWPNGVLRDRIDELHGVMRASRKHGCNLIPRVRQSAILAGGYAWDLIDWMPGQPLDCDASLKSIQQGAAAIARYHNSTRALGVCCQIAPAIRDRLTRLKEIEQSIDAAINAGRSPKIPPPLNTAVLRAAQLLSMKWKQARSEICRLLDNAALVKVTTQYVSRDVHREHILFSAGQPSGLIDFDAVRFDSPAVDISRWAGSGWMDGEHGRLRDGEGVWSAVLAGIRSEDSFNNKGYFDEPDILVARAMVSADPWISLANWLIWLMLEQRQFSAGPEAVAKRISTLTDAASQAVWLK